MDDSDREDTPYLMETPRTVRKVKTALHQAVLDCRIEQVRLLVEKHKADVNAQDMYGRTPLMLASLMDNELYGFKMVKLFMGKTVNINIQDNLGRTVLHYGAIKGRERMVKMILGHDDVSVGLPDREGNTALMLACICGYIPIVNVLVDVTVRYGLSIDERNSAGFTALLLACQQAKFICARILVTKGEAQVTLKDHQNGWDAKEWIKNTGNSHIEEYHKTKNHTLAGLPPRSIATFYREKTMYPDSTIERSCKHAASAPATRSIGSALRLPSIFKKLPEGQQPWTNEASARELLLNAIDTSIVRSRALSRRSKSTRSMASSVSTRYKTPSSAKLRALDEPMYTQSATSKKSVHILFKIYSERISWHDEEDSQPNLAVPGISIVEPTPEPPHIIY